MTEAKSSKSNQPFHVSFLCGGLAGASVDAILFPLDTIKTRLQVRRAGATADAAAPANLYRNFYRGLTINCVGSFLSSGLFWTVYENTKRQVTSILPVDARTGRTSEAWLPAASVASAATADVTACMIRVPFEVIKQQMQAGLHRSTTTAFTSILSKGGWGGLYAGFRATVIRELPFDAIEFTLYEAMKHRYCQYARVSSADGAPAVVLGAIAGGAAAGITTPLDTVKTRLMTQPSAAAVASAVAAAAEAKRLNPSAPALPVPRRYTGIMDVLTSIAREEGPHALFRGIVPRVMWISVGGGIYFGTYEKAVHLMFGKANGNKPTAAH